MHLVECILSQDHGLVIGRAVAPCWKSLLHETDKGRETIGALWKLKPGEIYLNQKLNQSGPVQLIWISIYFLKLHPYMLYLEKKGQDNPQ